MSTSRRQFLSGAASSIAAIGMVSTIPLSIPESKRTTIVTERAWVPDVLQMKDGTFHHNYRRNKFVIIVDVLVLESGVPCSRVDFIISTFCSGGEAVTPESATAMIRDMPRIRKIRDDKVSEILARETLPKLHEMPGHETVWV